MRLHVSNLEDDKLHCEVDKDLSVAGFKNYLEEWCHIPLQKQVLLACTEKQELVRIDDKENQSIGSLLHDKAEITIWQTLSQPPQEFPPPQLGADQLRTPRQPRKRRPRIHPAIEARINDPNDMFFRFKSALPPAPRTQAEVELMRKEAIPVASVHTPAGAAASAARPKDGSSSTPVGRTSPKDGSSSVPLPGAGFRIGNMGPPVSISSAPDLRPEQCASNTVPQRTTGSLGAAATVVEGVPPPHPGGKAVTATQAHQPRPVARRQDGLRLPDGTSSTDALSRHLSPDVSMLRRQRERGNEVMPRPIRRADLQCIGRLGNGAFGKVTLEMDSKTGQTYAMKAVSKGYLQHVKMEMSVINEKNILQMVDSPFIVRLFATYLGTQNVYFLLEAALGGELFVIYEKIRLYGSEKHALFYVGCVTEALDYLHGRQVLYRDLKPENLLLDESGYCKITDMGLAKIIGDNGAKTFTMVGTPEYMAPEVIRASGHGKPVDWWMTGILLYELLVGNSPFESPSQHTQETYDRILTGIQAVQWPRSVPSNGWDLVQRLLQQSPEARPAGSGVRGHAWFRNFSWNDLRQRNMQAPLIPEVKDRKDLRNFQRSKESEAQEPPSATSGYAFLETAHGPDWTQFEDQHIGARRAHRRACSTH